MILSNFTAGNISSIQKKLGTTANSMRDIVTSTYLNKALDSSETRDAWSTADVAAIISSNNKSDTVISNLNGLYNLYIQHAISLSSISNTSKYKVSANLTQSSILYDTDWRFIMDNGPKTLIDEIWQLMFAYQNSFERNSSRTNTILACIAALITLCSISLTAGVSIPAIHRFKTERLRSLHLFYMVPTEVVDNIIKSKLNSLRAHGQHDKLHDRRQSNRGGHDKDNKLFVKTLTVYGISLLLILSLIVAAVSVLISANQNFSSQ